MTPPVTCRAAHRPGKMTQPLEIVGVDGGAGLYLYSDQAASAFGQEIDLIPVAFPVEEKVASFPLVIAVFQGFDHHQVFKKVAP